MEDSWIEEEFKGIMTIEAASLSGPYEGLGALGSVDLADGHRTARKPLASGAREGSNVFVTRDLKYYAYSAPRYSSDLYVVGVCGEQVGGGE